MKSPALLMTLLFAFAPFVVLADRSNDELPRQSRPITTNSDGSISIKAPSSREADPAATFDLRSPEEQEMEARSNAQLSSKDEKLAHDLVLLTRKANNEWSSDNRKYELTKAQISKIGKSICANGGHDRMVQIAYRVQALGGRIHDCEVYWDGICGWRQ